MHLCGIQISTNYNLFTYSNRDSPGIGVIPIMDQFGILDLHQRNKWKCVDAVLQLTEFTCKISFYLHLKR